MIKTEESPILSAPERRAQAGEVATNPTQPGDEGDDFSEIVIRPQSGWIAIDWKELFAHRELLYFLICATSRCATSRRSWAAHGPFCSLCC